MLTRPSSMSSTPPKSIRPAHCQFSGSSCPTPRRSPCRHRDPQIDGTAIAGDDYKPRSGTLVFQPGQDTLYIRVPLHDDGVDEPTETITVRLSNPVGATIADGTAEGRIRNR